MKLFKDAQQRTWELRIDVPAMRTVRQLVGVDLWSLTDNQLKPLNELLSDPCKTVDVLYCLCKEQADRMGMSDVGFGGIFDGDSYDAATTAFVEELAGFFPQEKRRLLLKMLAKGRELGAQMAEKADKELDALNLDSLEKILSESRGNVSESSASTPPAGPTTTLSVLPRPDEKTPGTEPLKSVS